MKSLSIISFILSVFFAYKGFNKMFVYNNPENSLLDHKNVYVGGDAYNYIINSNFSTSYFILALIFVILGSLFLLLIHLSTQTSLYRSILHSLEQTNNKNEVVTQEESIKSN